MGVWGWWGDGVGMVKMVEDGVIGAQSLSACKSS